MLKGLVAAARPAAPASATATEIAPTVVAFFAAARAELLSVSPGWFDLIENVEAPVAGPFSEHGERKEWNAKLGLDLDYSLTVTALNSSPVSR